MGLCLHPPICLHGAMLSKDNFIFIFLEYFTEYFNVSSVPDLYSEGINFNPQPWRQLSRGS
jgi:hypothetical protein